MIHRCKEPSGFPLAALLYGAGSGPVALYRKPTGSVYPSASVPGRDPYNATHMYLLLSRNFPKAIRTQLLAEWEDIFGSTEFSELMMKADVPSPEFIQILAEARAWVTPLKAAATAFLLPFLGQLGTQLGKRTADAIWSKGSAALKRAAAALVRARDSSPGRPIITIGLSLPDDFYGTAITFHPDHESEAARVLACFVLSASAIEAFVTQEMTAGRLGRGGVTLDLQPDGSFVARWRHPETLEDIEHTFPPPVLTATM